MRKTGLAIEEYIHGLLKGQVVVSGGVYRNGTRPFDSNVEDVVVSFLTGRDSLDGFSQSGVVNVNAYVPMRNFGGPLLVKDVKRCEELEEAISQLVDAHRTGDFLLVLDGTPTTFSEEGFSVVNVRVKYKYNKLTE
nr:MAG TPA: hypothetical protein [Caudoviricetes sp.]